MSYLFFLPILGGGCGFVLDCGVPQSTPCTPTFLYKLLHPIWTQLWPFQLPPADLHTGFFFWLLYLSETIEIRTGLFLASNMYKLHMNYLKVQQVDAIMPELR